MNPSSEKYFNKTTLFLGNPSLSIVDKVIALISISRLVSEISSNHLLNNFKGLSNISFFDKKPFR